MDCLHKQHRIFKERSKVRAVQLSLSSVITYFI